MTRRSPRPPESRSLILEAARALVLEKGVERVSLRDIARRAGFSPSSLYEHFDGKGAIIGELVQLAGGDLVRRLKQVPQELPPVERLLQLGLAYLAFARQQPEDFALLYLRLRSARTSTAQSVPSRSPYAVVLTAVQHAISLGQLRTRPSLGVEEITYTLWALVHGMATLQATHLRQFDADFAKIDRAALECFLEGLR